MTSPAPHFTDDDTIVAIATPPGVGGIGIVRLSGADAFRIGHLLFAAANGQTEPPSHQLIYGHAIAPGSGERIDEALAVFMQAPYTYTREPVVEIHAHGGPLILRRIVAEALAAGARAARAGEMTLRAFLNGRLDLARAEAVMSLINAETEAGRRLAMRQLDGQLSRQVEAARGHALAALRDIEASIDFPEEEVPEPDRASLREHAAQAGDILATLLATARQGRLIRDGARVVIVGRPNVGKSSLLNALLGRDRAIVTPIAGTTRDTVEEAVAIEGMPIHLVDTAGLTASDDPVERIGVERSRAAAQAADALLFVLDASAPITAMDGAAADAIRNLLSEAGERAPVVVVRNKCDLPTALDAADARALWPDARSLRVSCLTGEGLAELRDAIGSALQGDGAHEDAALVSSVRHQHALQAARDHLAEAQTALGTGVPLDLVSIDLRAALDALGEVTGETATADLLDRIFAEFCIGK
ncbi:MAG TPA: tRNA uridine-5-carboxymethylaminomethyl(34) synthesis GTPase MnmE [Ktedonobacterales bacterium]